MLKRISFLAAIFAVCAFAEDSIEAEPVPAEATEFSEVLETGPAEAAESSEVLETEPAPAVDAVATAPDETPAPAADETAGSAKEAIIENPIEFAIVTAVFIATVLLIALTGD
jgi:outer membrane biosynthesis protein TonB